MIRPAEQFARLDQPQSGARGSVLLADPSIPAVRVLAAERAGLRVALGCSGDAVEQPSLAVFTLPGNHVAFAASGTASPDVQNYLRHIAGSNAGGPAVRRLLGTWVRRRWTREPTRPFLMAGIWRRDAALLTVALAGLESASAGHTRLRRLPMPSDPAGCAVPGRILLGQSPLRMEGYELLIGHLRDCSHGLVWVWATPSPLE